MLGELIANPVPLRVADVGAHPRSYGFPAEHPRMKTFLGVPVMVSGEPFGNLYLTEKAGGEEFSERDEEVVVLLAGFAGVAIAHARGCTGLESRHSESRRTVDALDATMQIALAVGGETDLGVILGWWPSAGGPWCPAARRSSSTSTRAVIGPGARSEYSDSRDGPARAAGDRAEADAAPGSDGGVAPVTPA